MVKPIVRWTIGGNSSDEGFRCLQMAITAWRKIYHDEHELYVCHNSMSHDRLSWLKSLSVNLVCQEDFVDTLPIPPSTGPEWKLYPPRLSLQNHEMFIDNDVVIYERLNVLDEALLSNVILASTAVTYAYGSFQKLVKLDRTPVNTGFLLFPPGYDLRKKVSDVCYGLAVKWEKFCDEQGLLACLLYDNAEFIPLHMLAICHYMFDAPCYGTCGSHFVGLNRNKNPYFKLFMKRYPNCLCPSIDMQGDFGKSNIPVL